MTTHRGRKILAFGGYRFHVHSQYGVKTYWRCADMKAGCHAIVHTVSDEIITIKNQHNHAVTVYRH